MAAAPDGRPRGRGQGGASAGRAAAVWPPCQTWSARAADGAWVRRLRSQELHQACKCGGAVPDVESCGEQLVSSRIASFSRSASSTAKNSCFWIRPRRRRREPRADDRMHARGVEEERCAQGVLRQMAVGGGSRDERGCGDRRVEAEAGRRTARDCCAGSRMGGSGALLVLAAQKCNAPPSLFLSLGGPFTPVIMAILLLALSHAALSVCPSHRAPAPSMLGASHGVDDFLGLTAGLANAPFTALKIDAASINPCRTSCVCAAIPSCH